VDDPPYFVYELDRTRLAAAMPSEAALQWVRETCGPIQAIDRLGGGVGHVNFAMTAGGAEVVLRWNARDLPVEVAGHSVRREAAALEALERHAVAAPRVVAADATGALAGAPSLIISRLPGYPPNALTAKDPSFLSKLAHAAFEIHRVTPPAGEVTAFRRFFDPATLEPPQATTRPTLWWEAIHIGQTECPDNQVVFVHRDYHPGNTVWSGDVLSGVVDWNAASTGPAGVDLGHMRWNLVVTMGPEAAGDFLARYRERSGESLPHQAYWDVVMVLDLLGDTVFNPLQLERIESHLTKALTA
jgi:aminoglycoside phosphotransferase (APT) family kinase protein